LQWYRNKTTTEAVLGNSFNHPRQHLYAYLRENGELERANRLLEEGAALLREVNAPPLQLGAALYNLAAAHVYQGRLDDALTLLEEALPMRPDFKESAPKDSDLADLHGDERFKALISR
jgi:tetratricopeptide (TPR) repeat protein